jgi:hypothetical protein
MYFNWLIEGALMAALRFVFLVVLALCSSISAVGSQQQVPEFFRVFGAIINSTIVGFRPTRMAGSPSRGLQLSREPQLIRRPIGCKRNRA